MSLNFAVVFDFVYFRFRPSKAKSIGRPYVLMYKQNAALGSTFFFFFIMRTELF